MIVTTVGSVRCTRVGYVDVDVAPEVVGLTADHVTAVGWAEPTWADDILRSEADAAVHQEAFAASLAAAGRDARPPRPLPLHLATGVCPLNLDPAAAHGALEALRDEGSLLIGPLWPEPGAGWWRDGTFVPLGPA